ncbi:MAG TPA: hypothetical protein VK196_05515 [Magnetospirillum sp.]|nr:hypothetical protein [Magnetospirillum sp.]
MTPLPRRAVLAGLLTLAPLTARASGGKGGGGEVFVKLPSVNVEFWDNDGNFHVVNMELTAVFPLQASINKKVGLQISHTLSAMAWEDFSRGNPAATVKAVALDAVRADSGGANCIEVLIIKLMMR